MAKSNTIVVKLLSTADHDPRGKERKRRFFENALFEILLNFVKRSLVSRFFFSRRFN